MLISMGSMMDVGFEHVLRCKTATRSIDVFSVYVFRIGIERLRFVIHRHWLFPVGCLIILLGTNFLAKKVSETSLF